jgi:predicted ATPase/DNA-binding winged helix-turn-helix (wHTH) protein
MSTSMTNILATHPYVTVAPSDVAPPAIEHDVLTFGSFTLHPKRHQLFRNGELVALGSRALDLLIALATRAGELVEKEELIAFAWPRVVVEECNLRAQIVALRRLLNEGGNDCIATVPGRGYRFVVIPSRQKEPASQYGTPVGAKHSTLPALIRETIGRDAVIERLCEQVTNNRQTSLVGPGGIGKTTVALEVAKRLEARFKRGARFIDLSDAKDSATVKAAVSKALGLTANDEDLWDQALAEVQEGNILLVLDNCEHMLGVVKDVVACLRERAPDCRILATSREPIQSEGERLERLPPLALPSSTETRLSELLRSPAVQMLVEHASAQDSNYVLHEEDAVGLNQLCQRLDGVPLEIEIAAARMGSFGIGPLLNMLDGEFRLQMAGRRTAAKRHRSMGAMLDWSYMSLRPCEQAALRLASTFSGSFTLNAIRTLIDSELPLTGDEALDVVQRLVDKSLLLTEGDGSGRYHLLSSTRLYATSKLQEAGGTQRAVIRHAVYALEVVRNAAIDRTDLPETWQLILGAEGDLVRSALAQACSAPGEGSPSLDLKMAALGLTAKAQNGPTANG